MKKKKTLILIIVIAVLVAAIAVLVVLLLNNGKKKEATATGVNGVISDGWDAGINTGGVETSEIQIPGYKDAKMQEGDKVLHLSIGNPETNQAGLYADVVLEDGTVLYESELIEPGYGIKDIPLSKTLEKGTYQAYVVYQAVTLDESHTPMNSVRSAFTLYVE